MKKRIHFLDVLKLVDEMSLTYNISAIEKRKNFGFQLLNLKDNGYLKYMFYDTKKDRRNKLVIIIRGRQ